MQDQPTPVDGEHTIYTYLEHHRYDDAAGVPDSLALREILSAVHGLEEFVVQPMVAAVAKHVLAGGRLANEEVGRLVRFADELHLYGCELTDLAERMSVLARDSEGGREWISEYGHVADDGTYRDVAGCLVPLGRRGA